MAAVHLRLLATEMTLRCYLCDHGNAPGSLEQLVPRQMQRVALDPFSTRPLVFHPNGTNWVLYSIGPDMTDDGGKPAGKIMSDDYLIGFGISKSGKGQIKGDLLYDSPW